MITIKEENIFAGRWIMVPTVIPVNCVGIPDAGLTQAWANLYPYAAYRYQRLCGVISKPPLTGWEVSRRIKLGRVTIIKPGDETWLLFPTKHHWREESRIETIRAGLESLKSIIAKNERPVVSLPAIGCGPGGLPWESVKAEIEAILGDLPTTIQLYPPKD